MIPHFVGHLIPPEVPIRSIQELTGLTPVQLTSYLSGRSADYQPASLGQVAGSLRQFLRFNQQQGWIKQSLSLALPQIARRAANDLPAYLTEPQLTQLLDSCDTKTAEGRRDRAIILCLARLGLRAGELAALELHDIGWRQGTVRLAHTKNGSAAELPLLEEVGQALASYLRRDRPDCSHPQVFVWHSPPRPMNRHAISAVVQRGLHRCGIELPRPGAHLLRHYADPRTMPTASVLDYRMAQPAGAKVYFERSSVRHSPDEFRGS